MTLRKGGVYARQLGNAGTWGVYLQAQEEHESFAVLPINIAPRWQRRAAFRAEQAFPRAPSLLCLPKHQSWPGAHGHHLNRKSLLGWQTAEVLVKCKIKRGGGKKKKVCNGLAQLLKCLPGHSFITRDVPQPLSPGNWTEDAKEKSDGNNSAVTRAGGFQSSALKVKYQKPVCKHSSSKKGYLIQEYLKQLNSFRVTSLWTPTCQS